ncbi:MAG TPA: squalene/phytoene synthase family protein [Aggregatilineales bacterium]|nr:squalene/phytoene synthase family protein [Aggregatilineales bacterium]
MTLQIQWEYRLVAWAEEALQNALPLPHIKADDHSLERAYHHCSDITKHHSRTFYIASGLLPPEKRRAVRALYAFCRVTDDIVDKNEDASRREIDLEAWRDRIALANPPNDDLVALAWADARSQFNVPNGYATQLIDGVKQDLTKTRYATFDELAEYSYGVASTVGLMAMHIIGFTNEEAIPYAVKLGVALQITNILRDVGEDWRGGRLYLPQDELSAFGLDETRFDTHIVDDKWREFMRFQIDRNRKLYHDSWNGIAMLNPDGRLAIGAAAELYKAILTDIEDHDYHVFNRRSHISTIGKLTRIPRIWWRVRRSRIA